MSIYSDYKCGAMNESEYRFYCCRENRRERAYDDEAIWDECSKEQEPESED